MTTRPDASSARVGRGWRKCSGSRFVISPTRMAAPAAAEPPASPEDAMPVSADNDGKKEIKRFKIVRVNKDGKTLSEDWVGPVNVPEVRSTNCSGDGPKGDREMVINKIDGKKHVIIICQNRIEKVAMRAADEANRAKDIQRMAYTRALEGLRNARQRIANDERMSAEERRDALQGIDESITDMESDMANPD